MNNKIMSLLEYSSSSASYKMGAEPSEELNISDDILDALVELVGSEEEVEAAAEASFNDLTEAFEKNELEMSDESVPEKLAIAALVVKLVEMGKLGPDEADSFIADHLE
jgi:hypothetical protein